MTSFLILAAHSFASLDAPVNVIFKLSAQHVGSFLTGDEDCHGFVTVGESCHRARESELAHHQSKQVGFVKGGIGVFSDCECLVAHGDSMAWG